MCQRVLSGFASFLLIAPLVVTAGCDDFNAPQKTSVASKPIVPPPPPVRRFILSKYSGDVAFDTRTGQICRTWDWRPLVPGKADTKTGVAAQVKFGEFAPTCSFLYQQYAAGSSPRFALSKFSGGVAFDTQTGQTCRTWEWKPTRPAKPDANGDAPEVVYGEYTPTCIQLFQQYKSGMSVPRASDQQEADVE